MNNRGGEYPLPRSRDWCMRKCTFSYHPIRIFAPTNKNLSAPINVDFCLGNLGVSLQETRISYLTNDDFCQVQQEILPWQTKIFDRTKIFASTHFRKQKFFSNKRWLSAPNNDVCLEKTRIFALMNYDSCLVNQRFLISNKGFFSNKQERPRPQ